MTERRDDIPRYVHDHNGVAVCEACGCELGSGQPDPPRKYSGHRDDCAFMLELWPDGPPNPKRTP